MSGGFGRRTRTKPPQMHGAMLSACAEPAPSRSPSSAQAINVSAVDPPPISASTATTAAAALAELREQRQRGDAGRIARCGARQTAVVAVNRLDEDAVGIAREKARGH